MVADADERKGKVGELNMHLEGRTESVGLGYDLHVDADP